MKVQSSKEEYPEGRPQQQAARADRELHAVDFVRYGVDDVRQLDVAGHGVDHLGQEAAAGLVECLRIGESNSERESVTVYSGMRRD